jgi:hypothetical protein
MHTEPNDPRQVWVADDPNDFNGWEILAMELVKDGVGRVDCRRHLPEGNGMVFRQIFCSVDVFNRIGA